MNKNLEKLAKDIIKNNQYMTLATVDDEGKPWAAAVCYAYDTKYNFYWASLPNSKHQTNIKNNPYISFTIFDSHQDWGEGIGVQGNGKVEKIKLIDNANAQITFFSRDYPYGKNNVFSAYGDGLKSLLKGKIYHFYKLVPEKIWVPDPDADVDARIEVLLNSH